MWPINASKSLSHTHSVQSGVAGDVGAGAPPATRATFPSSLFIRTCKVSTTINKTNSMLTRNLMVYLQLINNNKIIKNLMLPLVSWCWTSCTRASGHHFHACIGWTVIELESRWIYLSRLCQFRDTNALTIIPFGCSFFHRQTDECK